LASDFEQNCADNRPLKKNVQNTGGKSVLLEGIYAIVYDILTVSVSFWADFLAIKF
jgi:hypothetical protein